MYRVSIVANGIVEGGVVVMKVIQMNADNAGYQVSRLQECVEALKSSQKLMEDLREGQTGTLWTEDGKSVDLTQALRGRYASAKLWLDELARQLEEARVNLDKAIDETDQMDADQKAYYQNLLYRTTAGPMTPIAV